MSDTPRTDAFSHECLDGDLNGVMVVSVLLAQQLEREIAEVTKERDYLKKLIMNFCANQKWAAESWKAQKHIKPLFDVFMEGDNNE